MLNAYSWNPAHLLGKPRDLVEVTQMSSWCCLDVLVGISLNGDYQLPGMSVSCLQIIQAQSHQVTPGFWVFLTKAPNIMEPETSHSSYGFSKSLTDENHQCNKIVVPLFQLVCGGQSVILNGIVADCIVKWISLGQWDLSGSWKSHKASLKETNSWARLYCLSFSLSTLLPEIRV